MLGVALMNQEKYEKARKVLVRAVAQFPKEWKRRSVLGHVHGHQGDWRRAEEAYRKALDDARKIGILWKRHTRFQRVCAEREGCIAEIESREARVAPESAGTDIRGRMETSPFAWLCERAFGDLFLHHHES